MTITIISIFISYQQVAVFDPTFEAPFNHWTKRHFDQGFAWRPGSVSFRTIDDDEQTLIVEIDQQETEPTADVVRAIDVPFEVPGAGTVEIASISDSHFVELAPGMYQLRFECRRETGTSPTLRLMFRATDTPIFRLVRVDDQLRPDSELLTTAEPAV